MIPINPDDGKPLLQRHISGIDLPPYSRGGEPYLVVDEDVEGAPHVEVRGGGKA